MADNSLNGAPCGADAEALHIMLRTLLGDTFEYVGEAVNRMSASRRATVARIAGTALRRLGEAALEPGEVPPPVAGLLLEAGSFCRGAATAEYWGGVLACSRSASSRDERAARRLAMLARLGEYHIRSHYLFYSALRLLLLNTRNPAAVNFDADRLRLATFIPAGYYILAMDYQRDEIKRMPILISDVLHGLGQELLLDGSNTGSDAYLKTQFTTNTAPVIRGEGIVFAPSAAGIQLFLWAFGVRDADNRRFLDPTLDCRIAGIPMGVDEAGLVYRE